MATLIKSNGTTTNVFPTNKKAFSLKELQAFVGGNIQTLNLPTGLILVCNEDGIGLELPDNKLAQWAVQRAYDGRDVHQMFVGDVLFLEPTEMN